MDKKRVIIAIGITVFSLLGCSKTYADINNETGSSYPLKPIEATAYCNPNGNLTYSETPTIEGRTIAGRVEDIGKVGVVYSRNPDGSIGDFIGIYEFQDTGWGENGEIPAGTRVDIYMEDYDRCISFGEQDVYIQIIEGKG